MKKFIIFYKGPATPPGASHEGWPEWFDKIGDKLVDRGSPMNNGFTVRSDGSTNDSATNLNGFSGMQRTALRAAADAERWLRAGIAKKEYCCLPPLGSKSRQNLARAWRA